MKKYDDVDVHQGHIPTDDVHNSYLNLNANIIINKINERDEYEMVNIPVSDYISVANGTILV